MKYSELPFMGYTRLLDRGKSHRAVQKYCGKGGFFVPEVRSHSFDCGVPSLNDWLVNRVSQFEKKDLSRTYVLIEDGDVVVKGYYAISNHTVMYDALPEDQAKGLPRIDVPVVLIG